MKNNNCIKALISALRGYSSTVNAATVSNVENEQYFTSENSPFKSFYVLFYKT